MVLQFMLMVHTLCMKYQTLFLGKIKHVINLSSGVLAQMELKVEFVLNPYSL